MGAVNFDGGASPSSSGSFSLDPGWVQSTGVVPFPTNARQAKNGQRPVRPTSIQVYISGYYGTISVTISLTGIASTSSFSRAKGTSAGATGYKTIGGVVPNGGDVTCRVNASDGFYFGRGSSGSTVNQSGYSWTGALSGTCNYATAPSAPRSLVAAPGDPGDIVLTWIAPSDLGDTTITGYRVEVSTSSTFATIVDTIDLGNVLTYTWADGTPGTTYYFRVAAKNIATDAIGSTSVDSTVASASVNASARRWDGAAEVPTSVLVRWDGSAEVPITTAVRWDGSQEVPLT